MTTKDIRAKLMDIERQVCALEKEMDEPCTFLNSDDRRLIKIIWALRAVLEIG